MIAPMVSGIREVEIWGFPSEVGIGLTKLCRARVIKSTFIPDGEVKKNKLSHRNVNQKLFLGQDKKSAKDFSFCMTSAKVSY